MSTTLGLTRLLITIFYFNKVKRLWAKKKWKRWVK